MKRTTIEQLRASPVQLPTSQPGSPKLEEMSSKIRQMHADIKDLNVNATRKLSIQDFDNVSQLQEMRKVCSFYTMLIFKTDFFFKRLSCQV